MRIIQIFIWPFITQLKGKTEDSERFKHKNLQENSPVIK